MLRIIHTSDIHLGAKFTSFGASARTQRQALQNSFVAIVDQAISSKANLFLVAGDLFDSNFPSQQTVSFVKGQLKRLNDERIYATILPGTHDCLSKESIYKRENFGLNLPYVYVFDDPATTSVELPDIDATIFAKANTSNKSSESPVAFLAQAGVSAKTKYKVAMAHGSVQIEGKAAPDDMPITFREIAESGMHYVALGHWHGAQECSFGNTIAWYAGSPEITYQEGKGGLGQGYVLSVDIIDSAQVKPVKISEKTIQEVDIDMQIYENVENVLHELGKLADPHCILIATIFGFAESAVFIDPEQIERALEDKFFSITVKSKAMMKMPEITALNYPEELVIGQFVRIMQKKIEATQVPDERRVLEDALQMGIAELEGKNVLTDE